MRLLKWSKGVLAPCKLVCCIFVLTANGSVSAGELGNPFASANRNPFVQIYGLPSAQTAGLLSTEQSRLGVQLEVANNFTVNDTADEAIVIDGETHRINMQFRYGISDHIELGLDVPYLSHESGRLDGFIDDWHHFFDLPDGGRPDVAKDQLRYGYRDGGITPVDVQQSTDGIGDVSVSAAYQLLNNESRQWALRGGVKLPTGDADSLQGSESTDVFAGVNVSDQGLLEQYNIVLHGSVGALWMNGGEVIDDRRNDWVVYGSSTVSWLYNEHISFKAQLDLHSAFYDSELTELGDSSAQLILGGALKLADHWVLDLSVSEDIAVDTAPDVIFQIGLTVTGN